MAETYFTGGDLLETRVTTFRFTTFWKNRDDSTESSFILHSATKRWEPTRSERNIPRTQFVTTRTTPLHQSFVRIIQFRLLDGCCNTRATRVHAWNKERKDRAPKRRIYPPHFTASERRKTVWLLQHSCAIHSCRKKDTDERLLQWKRIATSDEDGLQNRSLARLQLHCYCCGYCGVTSISVHAHDPGFLCGSNRKER